MRYLGIERPFDADGAVVGCQVEYGRDGGHTEALPDHLEGGKTAHEGQVAGAQGGGKASGQVLDSVPRKV